MPSLVEIWKVYQFFSSIILTLEIVLLFGIAIKLWKNAKASITSNNSIKDTLSRLSGKG